MTFNLFSAARCLAALVCAVTVTVGSAKAQHSTPNAQLAYANSTISFSGNPITTGQAMEDIKRQTAYAFAFDASVFDTAKEIRLTARELPFNEALDQIFAGQPVDYVVRGKMVAVTATPKVVETPAPVQPRTNDLYVRNAPGSVGSAPNPRPVKPEPVILAEPVKVDLPAYPESFTDYRSIESITDNYKTLPRFAVKTNLLYTAATFTPNLGIEFGVGPKSTVELSASYNWQGREDAASDNHKQKVHSLYSAGYRYWLCERFNGHAFGAQAIYTRFNVSGYDVPMLFDKENRYDGNGYGLGISYTYHWAFAKRWAVEFNAGVGYLYMDYDQFDCAKCDRAGIAETKNYFGPTRLGINLVFLIK